MELQLHTEPTEDALVSTSEAVQGDETVPRDETRAAFRQLVPKVDILEGADAMWLVFDLPGVSEADIDLRVERGDLSLSAEDPSRGRVYRRAFSLPDTVDANAVAAELEAGVLRVSLGKRSEAKARRIPVRSAD